jgi:ABC-type tungstate transport system permease subunit
MPPTTRRILLVSAIGVQCLAMSFACQRPAARVRMATTTSVENSGLLAAILPGFERDSHVAVEVLPVGSGQAMNLLKRGEVAVGLTHDPTAEATALAAGIINAYQKIMFAFVIVGPPDDRRTSRVERDRAFARIAASNSAASRRRIRTHTREQAVRMASVHRTPLLDTGQGMGHFASRAARRVHAGGSRDVRTVSSCVAVSLALRNGMELLNTRYSVAPEE